MKTPCYQCLKPVTYLFPDSRCSQCTRLEPDPSTPPVENSNPERVAPQGADGQGVYTLSETDISLLRSYNERVEAHEVLTSSGLNRKFGPLASALFTARCVLRTAVEKNVEDFRSWGMLLHVGVVQ